MKTVSVCLLCVSMQFLPLNRNKGEHGFDNEVMDMKALFRAVGPDFHKNLQVQPVDLVDLYPLMCHLLRIEPEIHDGLFNNSRHMLRSSPGGQESGG